MPADALLLDLYATPAQPARWQQVLDRLCDETGSRSAVVQAFRFDGDGVRLQWQAMDRRTAGHQALPQARYAALENPRFARHRSMRGLNRVVRDDDLFERGDPDRDALRHTLADIGIGHFMGTLQPLDDGHYLAVALHRAVEDHADYGGAAVARLEALAPHLRQAWDITQQVQGGQRQLGGLQAHLDQLRCGLLLCDEQAQVRWLNRSARQLVQRGAALQVRDGVLRAASPAATTTLHAQIARAEAQAGFLAVGDGPSRLHLALRRTVEGGVLVAATRVGDGVAVPTAAWSRLLGVTAAEAALVATLVDGGTLEEHAQRRGVSAGTVRGQLKQVLSKTGTHRQAELVRLALSSAAAHLLDSVPAVGD